MAFIQKKMSNNLKLASIREENNLYRILTDQKSELSQSSQNQISSILLSQRFSEAKCITSENHCLIGVLLDYLDFTGVMNCHPFSTGVTKGVCFPHLSPSCLFSWPNTARLTKAGVVTVHSACASSCMNIIQFTLFRIRKFLIEINVKQNVLRFLESKQKLST